MFDDIKDIGLISIAIAIIISSLIFSNVVEDFYNMEVVIECEDDGT